MQHNGSLLQSEYDKDANINFNAFTADLNFGWYFAPVSELSVVWKNSILTNDKIMVKNYFDDLSNTINSPQTNGISIRFLYYIDYLYFKKWFGMAKPI